MSKTRSRIVLNFYEDDYKDLAILEMLDELVSKRNRTYKVKDLLLEIFQQDNYKDRFEELKNKIKNTTETKIKKDIKYEINDIEKSLSGWSEE